MKDQARIIRVHAPRTRVRIPTPVLARTTKSALIERSSTHHQGARSPHTRTILFPRIRLININAASMGGSRSSWRNVTLGGSGGYLNQNPFPFGSYVNHAIHDDSKQHDDAKKSKNVQADLYKSAFPAFPEGGHRRVSARRGKVVVGGPRREAKNDRPLPAASTNISRSRSNSNSSSTVGHVSDRGEKDFPSTVLLYVM